MRYNRANKTNPILGVKKGIPLTMSITKKRQYIICYRFYLNSTFIFYNKALNAFKLIFHNSFYLFLSDFMETIILFYVDERNIQINGLDN